MRVSATNPLKMLVLSVPIVAMVAACGARPGERALSGGVLGAAAGAAITAATGGTIWAGTLIGGAVGAAVGAATSPRRVNLGPSPFR